VKVANVVGARPNFMKIAPVMRLMKADPFFQPQLIHTGQHYDEKLSDVFLRELGLPEPDFNLYAGSGSHGKQTGEVMIRFEEVVAAERPDLVLVVGDVNSTLAAALVAVKLHIPVAHVEAGLRSYDRSMPEEINRVLTDAVSELLFVTEKAAVKNLTHEGVPAARIHFVGNVMIDTLFSSREKAAKTDILERLRVAEGGYAVLTMHRPSNVDEPEPLGRILEALEEIGREVPILFPAHPRTIKRLTGMGMLDRLEHKCRVRVLPPLGYLEFVRLVDCARIVLTDSGGLQEETTVLGVPCITMRENTERPVTVEQGTSTLVGNDTAKIVEAARLGLKSGKRTARIPELWDGRAAERIVHIIKERFGP
jgi:UDP-N-acetylglucosamine 2-epimerase (non-hydrolysing)